MRIHQQLRRLHCTLAGSMQCRHTLDKRAASQCTDSVMRCAAHETLTRKFIYALTGTDRHSREHPMQKLVNRADGHTALACKKKKYTVDRYPAHTFCGVRTGPMLYANVCFVTFLCVTAGCQRRLFLLPC